MDKILALEPEDVLGLRNRLDADQRKAGKLRRSVQRQSAKGATPLELRSKTERLLRMTEGLWHDTSVTSGRNGYEYGVNTDEIQHDEDDFDENDEKYLETTEALLETLEATYRRQHYRNVHRS